MMKAGLFVLLCLYCTVECRKAYVPIDKNANLAFINMEAGGGGRPSPNQPPVAPNPTVKPQPSTNVKPEILAKPTSPPPKPIVTLVAPTPAKPGPVANPTPSSIKPIPPKPASPTPVTTPGPGTVKQLVNFYDSQGKASPIRPYSYSQAVKQG